MLVDELKRLTPEQQERVRKAEGTLMKSNWQNVPKRKKKVEMPGWENAKRRKKIIDKEIDKKGFIASSKAISLTGDKRKTVYSHLRSRERRGELIRIGHGVYIKA